MVKKEIEKKIVLCKNCTFLKDNECTHNSNLLIKVRLRQETVTYKEQANKVECVKYVQSNV